MSHEQSPQMLADVQDIIQEEQSAAAFAADVLGSEDREMSRTGYAPSSDLQTQTQPRLVLPPSFGRQHTFIVEHPAAGYVAVTAPSSAALLSTAQQYTLIAEDPAAGHGTQPSPKRSKMIYTARKYVRQKHQNIEFTSVPKPNVPLYNGEAGAVETPNCMPHTTQRPKFGVRLLGNGLKTDDMAMIQLHARGQASKGNIRKCRAKLRRQILNSGKYVFNNTEWTSRENADVDLQKKSDYDLSGYTQLPAKRRGTTPLKAARLIDLARDIVNMPSLDDSGFSTQATQSAVQHNDASLTTDDVQQLALREDFVMQLARCQRALNWDKDGRDRVLAVMGLAVQGSDEGSGDEDDGEDEEDK
ncbi:hypothetical protein B0A55_03739 [Friedmanniomyces simplex]|uniref:Uncharacterized protein n=1 Tax=Friedmanniomyces simplex TaxID=329884 RepID=A0A4U0XH20_9PEZI|nr:hypothetical protein B0A55_03739 [Friedmanniomyces simplex]